MNPAWPMFNNPVNPKWMFNPITAIATPAVCGETASRSIALMINVGDPPASSTSTNNTTIAANAIKNALRTGCSIRPTGSANDSSAASTQHPAPSHSSSSESLQTLLSRLVRHDRADPAA